LAGVVQPASDDLRRSSVRRRRDVDRMRRGRRIQRDRNEFEHIDGIDVDINRFAFNRIEINNDLKPDKRLDDDGIGIK
jgi:hypothetical protein